MAVAGDIKIVMTLDDKDFSVKIKNAGQVIRDLTKDLKQTATSTKATEDHFNSLSTKTRHLLQNAGMLRFALYDLRDAFHGTFGMVIKTNAEMERMTKLMEGLSNATSAQGRAADALKGKNFVIEMSKNAPFEIKALTDSYVKFKSSGIDPANGSMLALVDSVAKFGGTSEHLHRASIAIQQMSGKGVISMEELRQQLGEAIPNAMQLMAKGAGMSMAELVKHISKGEVESKSALDRMFTMMKLENQGAAADLMETWNGQFAKLQTNFALFLTDIGGNKDSGLFAVLKGELKSLNDLFATTDAKKFAGDIGIALKSLISTVTSVTKAFRDNWKEVKLVGEVMLAVWGANRIVSLLSGITAAIRSQITATTAAMAVERSRSASINVALQEELNAKRKKIMDESALERKRLADSKIAMAEEVAALKIKYAQETALAEAYHAKARALDLAASRGGISRVAVEGNRQSALSFFNLSMETEKSSVKTKKALEVMSRAHVDTMVVNRNITQKATESLLGLGTTAVRASGMMGLLRGGLALLGGPIGIITALVTAGIFAWMEWGDEAKKAISGAQNAADGGYASLKDAAILDKAAKETLTQKILLTAKLEEANAKLNNAKTTNVFGDADGHLKAENIRVAAAAVKHYGEELEKLNKISKDAVVARKQGTESILSLNVAENAKNIKVLMDVQFTAYEKDKLEHRQLLQDKMEANKVALAKNEITEKEFKLRETKAQDDLTKEEITKYTKLKATQLGIQQASVNKIKELLANAEKSGNALGTASFKAQLTAQTAALLQAQDDLAAAKRLGTSPDLIATKNDGDPTKHSAIDKLLISLRAKKEDLAATIKGIDGDLAAFESRISDGVYGEKRNKKGKIVQDAATKEELAEAKALYQEQFKQSEEIDRLNKIIGDAATARTNVAEMTRNSQIELSDAMANYYDTGSADKSMTALHKQLEKMKEALTKASTELGGTEQAKALEALRGFDAFKAKVLSEKGAIQASSLAVDFREKANAIEVNLVDNRYDQIEAAYNKEIAKSKEVYESKRLLAEGNDQAMRNLDEQYNRWSSDMSAKRLRDLETPLQKLARDWKDTTKQMQDATTGWADQAVDAFVQFAKTGKLNFSSLIDSILTDIIRMQTRKEFAQFLMPLMDSASAAVGNWMSGVFQFANGGIMNGDGAVELRKYATGGIANTPQLAMYGEGSMAEAYVPLPDGRSIPVTMSGGAGAGGANNVTVNVINQTSTPVSASKSQPRFDGRQMVLDIVLTAASQPGQFRDGMKGALV